MLRACQLLKEVETSGGDIQSSGKVLKGAKTFQDPDTETLEAVISVETHNMSDPKKEDPSSELERAIDLDVNDDVSYGYSVRIVHPRDGPEPWRKETIYVLQLPEFSPNAALSLIEAARDQPKGSIVMFADHASTDPEDITKLLRAGAVVYQTLPKLAAASSDGERVDIVRSYLEGEYYQRFPEEATHGVYGGPTNALRKENLPRGASLARPPRRLTPRGINELIRRQMLPRHHP